MIHLGLNIYYWGEPQQIRLLVECLGPTAREIRRERLAERFWFGRFDARGPHLVGLFTTSSSLPGELAGRLSTRVKRYLQEQPSCVLLAPEEIERRHSECRGKVLCIVDGDPGFADNNTLCLFQHEPRGYPFSLSHGLPMEDELWRLLDDLAFWTIEQLARKRAVAAAVQWIAAMDLALRCRQCDAESYWRYHAATLLVDFEERFQSDPEKILTTLPVLVGERNQRTFSQVWDAADRRPAIWPHFNDLVKVLLAGNDRSEKQRWALLREVNHCTLAQLFQPVRLHIPLVLYAWQRNAQPSVNA